MSSSEKKNTRVHDIPREFDELTKNIISRIEHNPNVVGIMHLQNDQLQLYTVPEAMLQILSRHLPHLSLSFKLAIGDIDIFDKLLAYRIEANGIEIMVVPDKDFNACVVHKTAKKKRVKKINSVIKASHDEWLVKTTSSLNDVNPIVDRIMEDDSVEGVIMTNEEGVPILTSINLNGATNYSLALKRLGEMTRNSTKEIVI
ncbi:unnamed protein product, partial [Brenthis ino]